MEDGVFTPKWHIVFRLLDQEIIWTFKHYCCKQLVRTVISVIGHQLLYGAAALMKVNVLDVVLFIAVSWCSATHMTIVNCSQNYGFNLNEMSDGDLAKELIQQGEWGQLKTGVLFEEYVSSDSGIVDWDVNLRTNDG